MEKKIIITAIFGLTAIFTAPIAFSQAQYAIWLGVYPQCSGCHATSDDSSGNGGNSRNRLRGSVWDQCTLPQVLNDTKHLCEIPSVIPTCTTGQVLNSSQTACETPTPVIPTCTNGQVLNSAQTACETPAKVVPKCVLPQVLNVAKNICETPAKVVPKCVLPQVLNAATNVCITIPTCATGEFLNTTKTACVAPPVVRANTAPVLNAVAQQWDVKVGETITIPLSVKDVEQDEFTVVGSTLVGSKLSKVHPDAAGLPSIDFQWTPVIAQVNKIQSIQFYAKETKTTQRYTSNKVSVKIRVWAAGDRNAASITKLNVTTSAWKLGKLNLTGNVVFNSLLTADERQALLNQKMDLTITRGNTGSGATVGITALTFDKNGNWSATIPVVQAQVPCEITLQYDGQKASRVVSGAPSTCLKTTAANSTLQFAQNNEEDNESGESQNSHEHDD